jgi:hypothetical protein
VVSVRVQRVDMPGGERTWTLLGADQRRVDPVEAFLEYLRVRGLSPNTVKSYAGAGVVVGVPRAVRLGVGPGVGRAFRSVPGLVA